MRVENLAFYFKKPQCFLRILYMSQDEIIKTLKTMVEIPSVSSDNDHKKDVESSAEYVQKLFSDLGLKAKVAQSKGGQPAVIASTKIDSTKKTILLYAHHDVQPVGDLELWNTDPFIPEIINGRMYGRGSGDKHSGSGYKLSISLSSGISTGSFFFGHGHFQAKAKQKAHRMNRKVNNDTTSLGSAQPG